MINLIAILTAVTLTFHVQTKDPITAKVGLDACTAVYIAPQQALTAAHCVNDTTGHMWIRNADNIAHSAHVIKKDKKIDLCLLQIDGPPHPYVNLGSPVSVGDIIYSLGNDDNMPFTYGEGIVKNVLIDPDTHILTVVHSVTILPGASGGGLYNRWGRLVGINTMVYKGVSYAVDVNIIEGFLGKRR